MRKHTRLVVRSLLTGAAVACCVPGADSQTGTEPARGPWTPHVIATARPANEGSPPGAPAVPTVRQQPSDLPSPVRAGPTTGDAALPPAAPPTDPVRLVSGPPRGAPAAAPQGACLLAEKVGPAAVAAGKPLAYEIVVRNVGAAEARRVRVEEQIPAGATVVSAEPRPELRGGALTWDLGSLGAGMETRLRVALQPPADGDVTTTATVTCTTTSTLHTRVARSGLSLTVTGPPPARVGDGVTFKIQMANNTTTALRGLTLRARLADGLRHPAGGQLEATIPPLAPGEVKTVPLDVVAAKAGRLSLSASVTGAGAEPVSGEAAVEVSDTSAAPHAPVAPAATPPAPAPKPPEVPRGAPDLVPLPPPLMDPSRSQSHAAPATGGAAVTFNLKDTDRALEVGRETTYEIRVLNQGAAPTRQVLVQAVLPDEMTFIHADDPAGRPVQVYGQQVAFEPLASLGARGEAVYHVRVKATKPGDGRFTARMQCAAMSRPLSQEVNTRVYTDDKTGLAAGGR